MIDRTQNRPFELIETQSPGKAITNPARWIDRLAIAAETVILDPENRTRIGIPDLEAECRAFARHASEAEPLGDPEIGFDKPTNLYVVTEIYQSGGHRVLLEQMIAARPDERHVVVFSGTQTRMLEFGVGRVRQVGAFAVVPDWQNTLHDRYVWLRRKLASFAAQRVVLFHHPEDVLATAAAYEIAPRYGKRLYMVRHTDTRPTLGVELAEATHIVIRDDHRKLIQAEYPDLTCCVLPLSHSTERASRHLVDGGFFANGVFTTATAGADHKFEEAGEVAFGEVLAGIIRATRGRHIHIGDVSQTLKALAYKALDEAKLPHERLVFIGEVDSISGALIGHRVDMFIASFPVGGGLSVTEAASAGLPIAVYDPGGKNTALRYISGAGHRPDRALVWTRLSQLEAFLRREADDETLQEMAASSIGWYDLRLSPAKFARRLAAIIAVAEGRMRGTIAQWRDKVLAELFDEEFYAGLYPDVADSGMNLLDHFRDFGDSEGRSGSPLFDVKHYLGQLSEGEREVAEQSPMTHYAVRGELRGLSPNPVFDPVLCRGFLDEKPEASCALSAYLALPDREARTHMFFDGRHYAQGRGLLNEDFQGSLLEDFLTQGAEIGTSPHPLIDMGRFGPSPKEAFLAYLTKDGPSASELSPYVLFDPRHFCGGDAGPWRGGAPNLLWAHLIEGNKRNSDPHVFVSVDYVARMHGDVLLEPRTVVERIASGDFGGDTHPLIRSSHIEKQAPWLAASGQHSTLYFLQYGVAHNIDPHPYFSTQFYLYRNQDVVRSGLNPLVHYLSTGQYEGRLPHLFFDGNHYYRAWLKENGDTRGGPLLDYVNTGAGAFRHVQPSDPRIDILNRKMANRLLESGDEDGAAEFLLDASHPPDVSRHPTLTCEVRRLEVDMPGNGAGALLEGQAVRVRRPAVVHPGHIAPASGSYEADALEAVQFRGSILIAGNDGVILENGDWFDPGLHHFDPARMQLKENSGVVSVTDDLGKVLLRRHEHTTRIQSGIHACGSYSGNYFHFLIEILPRVMAADRLAPEGVPILTDDHMPAQHFQILRSLFPLRHVRRLSRGFSYRVEELYLGSAANVVHDVIEADEAPVDAVRYHPDVLRAFNGFSEGFRTDGELRKVYFKRVSGVRRMINGDQIEAALRERGFDIVQCDRVSFAEQVRIAANAEMIVAQSGAHLANILFARPGTRVLALYSNAPGTNFYLWDGIGQVLGLDVVNIAGWRIAGSNGAHIGTVHEDFTLPLDQLLPFLPRPETEAPCEDARACLDALYRANSEADSLTAAWTVTADRTPKGFDERLAELRERAGRALAEMEDDEAEGLLDHPFFADFGRNIRSGFATMSDYSDDEQALAAEIREAFEEWAEGGAAPGEDGDADADGESGRIEKLLAQAMLLLPAHRLPLAESIADMPERLAARYIGWLTAPPFLFREGDDAAYVDFARRLLEWFERQLSGPAPEDVKAMVLRKVQDIDLGQLFLVDAPVRAVAEARKTLLERLALKSGTPRASARPADGSEGRQRIGILCRTFDKGPDSEAVVAFFRAFDKSRFEIHAYSVGFRDRVVSADSDFAEEFDAVIDHRRVLTGDPRQMRESLLADELDVFLHANATTYGLRAQEIALFHRVAPVQMILNSHVPMSFGFDSFDAYVTGKSDLPDFEIDQAEYAEKLLQRDGPVICYLNSLKPRPEPLFDRAALGLAEDDTVLMNAGSLSKLRHGCLRTMMEALRAVPEARLLLAPYNPGWVARSQAFAFNRQLAEMAAETGIDPDRILVMGELSVAEAESALALCDIYLNPFPHGGATMTHLALINGKPPVTLRRRWTRSIDQFLIQSVGASELLASSEAEYVETVRRLAEDRDSCQRLARRIQDAARTAPFVDNTGFSKDMEAVVKAALDEFGTR